MPRTTNGKKRSRPAPPPPPHALVELLRSDSSVLEYFTSLQTSLDADVQQWKDRAQRYKEECKTLKRQLLQQKVKTTTPMIAASRGARFKKADSPVEDDDGSEVWKESESSSEEEEVESPKAKNRKRAAVRVDMDLSSDDVESSVEHHDAAAAAAAATAIQEDECTNDWTVYGLLLEAYNNLRQLGVALVVEEVLQSTEEKEAAEGSNFNNEHHSSDFEMDEVPTRYIRRSDHDVVADMLHAVHTLTRIQLQMKDSTAYPPFSTDSFIPCCNVESHPAAQGKECILEALSIMDVYCTNMTDSQWDKLFPPESADDAIRVGMRDRRHLVDMLLSSLSGEISDAWAVADRSSRLTSTALHYEAMEEEDEVAAPFVGQFGAKSLVRLSAIAEKCLLAQVVSRILHQRDEHQEMATLIWKYILSAALSFGSGDYPRLQPVLSLCVLESLLCSFTRSAGPQLLWIHPSRFTGGVESASFMRRGISLAVHAAVCAYKARLASSDDRISDISRVELACYDRLLKSQLSWLSDSDDKNGKEYYCRKAMALLNEVLNDADAQEKAGTVLSTNRVDVSIAAQLALITMGDIKTLTETVERFVREWNTENSWVFVACCSALRQLHIRQIDALRVKQGFSVASTLPEPSKATRQITLLFGTLLADREPSLDFVDTIMKCGKQLSDAELVLSLMRRLAVSDLPQLEQEALATTISCFLGTPFAGMKVPVVRTINLERRTDRMKAFMAQAQIERIMVAKAVAGLDVDDEHCAHLPLTDNDFDKKYMWGLHAFDGALGTMAEVVKRLSKAVGDSHDLTDFVETHWRPNDLKAFDKDARNDESLVKLSLSECACALSHIGSWKGVYRSLTTCQPSQDRPLEGLPFPFMISGYARGRSLLHSNDNMPPTPVCVVLEDDAILVDRFADRLAALLEELPRDFHFCSIGYSRPKTAPIAKYSTHLGIPSCIWYLTGYILSLEGAKHLLMDSLPVRGPVDSWIGLKMCANWDNVFGQAMGVGARASSVTAELPSRKDLARILNFRAFAALVPLCSQKVDTSTNTTVGRSWRQRDTDVTYSGNL